MSVLFPHTPYFDRSCTNRITDWGGKISQADLLAEAKRLRLAHWKIQKDAGVDIIPSNDFALYDQVLHQIQDFGVSRKTACCVYVFVANYFSGRS